MSNLTYDMRNKSLSTTSGKSFLFFLSKTFLFFSTLQLWSNNCIPFTSLHVLFISLSNHLVLLFTYFTSLSLKFSDSKDETLKTA